MPEDVYRYLLLGPGAAFLVALVGGLAGRRRAWAAGLALGLGLGVGQGLWFGWPDLPVGEGRFPDPQTEQRLVYGWGLLGVLGALAARKRGSDALLAACLVLPAWLLWNILKNQALTEALVELLPATGVLFVAATCAELVAHRRPGSGTPTGLFLATALGAGALFWGASVTLAEQGGVLAGAALASAALAVRCGERGTAAGAVGPASVALGVLALAGWRLADLPLAAALCVALAPCGALLALLARGRLAYLLALLGPALVAGAGQLVAYLLMPEDPYAGY